SYNHLTRMTLVYILVPLVAWLIFLFFTDPATPEIYTLSLHDALPIYRSLLQIMREFRCRRCLAGSVHTDDENYGWLALRLANERSEEHTSELQSRGHLVCRLLLEKKTGSTSGCGVFAWKRDHRSWERV